MEEEELTGVAPAGLFGAYVAGGARSFYPSWFADAQDRLRAVREAAHPLDPEVAAALEAQGRRYAPSPARERNLELLRAGAAAVVTGQQAGLFLGPLFTIYKAATAIRVARQLAAESGEAVVPVFWLQIEDHDLPEIAVHEVPRAGGGEPLAIRLPASAEDRASVAHVPLPPEEVRGALDELRRELGGLPHAEEHLSRLERCYRPGATWGEAFASLLAELFAAEGLVLVDPRDPDLARVPAAVEVHRRAIAEAPPIADRLLARVAAIEAAGFTAPVHVRAGAPLSFFHPEGPRGPRHRLDAPAREALLAALREDPLRFSTSALLRPILQDSLLPTAAYVAGPTELAYFAQLPPLYEAYGLRMPLVWPRASLRLIDEKTRRLCARFGIRPADAERPFEALLAAVTGPSPEGPEIAHALIEPFAAAVESQRRVLAGAGQGVDVAIEKTLGTVERAVAKLVEKYESARRHADADRLERARYLVSHLFPRGVPQERVYGLSSYAARHGERAVLDAVLDAIDPLDPSRRDVELGRNEDRHG